MVSQNIVRCVVDNKRTGCDTVVYMPLLFAGFMGLSFGSFLNVLIDRLPNGDSIMGRSRCDTCRRTLRWFELIPLVSWFVQRGRCLRCKKPVSVQYPLVEAASALLFMVVYVLLPVQFGAPYAWLWTYIVWCTASIMFLGIVVADFKYQIIPDAMLIVFALAMSAVLLPLPAGRLISHLLTGVSTGAAFYALWVATGGKGMGFGDVKLAAVMGFVLGIPGIVVGLYVAFLTGAFYGVILMLAGRAGMKSKVAFGPFLLAGFCISYFWSLDILRWWGFI